MNELNVGQLVSLSYHKHNAVVGKVYTGDIVAVSTKLITLSLGQDAYKSFKRDYISSLSIVA